VSGDPQSAIDQRNRAFWDELCGSQAAQALGITEITPESLKLFDDWYLAYYPYLPPYLDDLQVAGKRVLEIGLGFGTVGQALADRGARYTGVDIAAGPVAMMRDRLRWLGRPEDEAHAVQASVLELPWEDESFDVVVSIGCLHHTGDLAQAVSEVHRVLAPGGLAFVMLYNAHSYRQLVQVPGRWVRDVLAGRNAAEHVRGMYDQNAQGEAAPHTDYVSKRDVHELFRDFSTVSIDAQNFSVQDRYYRGRRVTPSREQLLGNVGRVLGLDLYIRASK
jgi:SAM-dependent methyltransferase